MSFERIADIVQRAQLAAGDKAGSADSASAQREQVKTVAAQFESMLLLQMLKEMRQSGSWDEESEGDGDTLGAESFFETLDAELANHLSKVRGFGLSQQLVNALGGSDQGQNGVRTGSERGQTMSTGRLRDLGRIAKAESLSGSPIAEVAHRPAAAAADVAHLAASIGADLAHPAAPGAAGDVAAAVSVPGRTESISVNPGGEVTSEFGWRRDPFTGRAKFHRGIDVRAAYGEDIQTAGAGRVVFSGTQRGYGTTVIVQHADGVKTRYAHLSATLVSAGDEVQAGQVLGRAGRSGRATGTHLHFEVIADGKHVDPMKWAEAAHAPAHSEALKHTGVVADLTVSNHSRTLR
jgi:murein DD-endopeptidase MepM/ murein hydrolase activator NlpD